MVALKLSRPCRTPSRRNLEIYAQVKIRGCSQTQTAADHKITQSRVSRIVAQVEEWRATSGAAAEPLSNTERRRHERWLARERWEMVFQRSLAELDASARTLTNERSGERDSKAFRETTRREQATSVQWMKTAIRAAENLLKLSELEPLAPPETAGERLEQERQAVSNWLVFQRHTAEQTGRVAKSDNLHQHVQTALEALIGPEGCEAEAQPPERASDRAAKLSAAIRAAQADHSAASPSSNSPPLNPPSPDCHNCHTPAAGTVPENDPNSAAEVAATRCAADRSAIAAATPNPASLPSAPPKNPPDMTPRRDPWEDEYERLVEERKTIRLSMGAVVRS